MTINKLLKAGIIPIFSHESVEISLAVVQAAYAGGVRVFEYTNRNANALANFSALIAARPRYFPDLCLGIGTVFDPETAGQFIAAGAEFVVAPVCNPAVGTLCRLHNVPWLPGCMTITEVFAAHQAGADIIKIFPGEVVGPAFVKSVKAVLPMVKLMVTGGVEPTSESLGKWLGAGAVGVGLGSQLFRQSVIEAGDWTTIRQTITNAFSVLNAVR